ncbi:MAG TPA: (Fe-S)-binding protein [Candidatus Bathyarchaeia archaeon]|nr:(Fe-S)-binding protein [Candidatus Bathyarchaeia archaeon]
MEAACMLPPRHKKFAEAIRAEGNPYDRPKKDRQKPYSTIVIDRDGEYLFFGGCTSTYLLPEVIQDSLKILRAGKVSHTFLGMDEPCCGSVMFRAGYSKSAEELALKNVKLFNQSGFSKIITVCSGCYRTFKVDYPELLGDVDFKVYPISEIISNLLREKRIRLNPIVEELVTYHDPCHLGIHCGVFDQPRDVIKNAYGTSFVEMVRNREDSRCCGAGGGVKSAFPEISVAMAEQRLLDAKATGAKRLLTSCPFCILNLRDAANQKRIDFAIDDLTTIVAKQLKQE